MPAFPHAAKKSHAVFEPGNTGLNSGLEPAKAMINIRMGIFGYISGNIEQIDVGSLALLFIAGTHALGAGALGLGLALIQLLQNMLANGRVCIDDGVDYFQLLALGMIKDRGYQRLLLLPL